MREEWGGWSRDQDLEASFKAKCCIDLMELETD